MHFIALGVDRDAKLGKRLNTSESEGGENEASVEEKVNKFSLHSS